MGTAITIIETAQCTVLDAGGNRQLAKLTAGRPLAIALMDSFPNGFPGTTPFVFVNDQPFEAEQVCSHILKADDQVLVWLRPGGFLFALGPVVGLLLSAAVAAAGLLLLGLLTPQVPELAESTSGDQASPFSEFQAQANRPRTLARIPNIYGRMRVWPDLLAPLEQFYRGRNQRVKGLYCIGEGVYELDQESIGETRLSRIPDADLRQYNPGRTTRDFNIVRNVENVQRTQLAPPDDGGQWSPWFRVPGTKNRDIWFDLAFPALYKINRETAVRNNASVVFEIGVRRADNTSNNRYRELTIQRKAFDEERFTISCREGGQFGLGLGSWINSNEFDFRIRRVTRSNGAPNDRDDNFTRVDDSFLTRIGGVERLNGQAYPGVTVCELSIDNSTVATALSGQRFNVRAARKLRRVDRNNGPTGERVTTRRLIDALGESILYRGRVNRNDVDWRGLIQIHDSLNDVSREYSEFNGVFDRAQSIEEEISTIAQLGRIVVVRQGRTYSFVRDERKDSIQGLFNGRNKAPDRETRVLTFATTADFDGVEVEYIEPLLDWKPYRYSHPNEDLLNPYKVQLVGAIHWEQAYRRAVYEWNRIRFRRDAMELTVTEDGILQDIYNRVTVTDAILSTFISGEVATVGSDLKTFCLDRVPSGASVGDTFTIRDLVGNAHAGTITSVDLASREIQLSEPVPSNFEFQSQNDDQLKPLWAIADNSRAAAADDWLITGVRPRGDGYVDLTLENYTDRPYNADTRSVPDNPSED